MMTSNKNPKYTFALIAFLLFTGLGTMIQAQTTKRTKTKKTTKTVNIPVAIAPPPAIVKVEPDTLRNPTEAYSEIRNIDLGPVEAKVGEKPSLQVKQRAKYKGNLIEDLGNALDYPDVPEEEMRSGRIRVQFEISIEGNVEDVNVLGAGLGAAYNNAAINAIKKLGPWEPAMENGKKVREVMVQHLNFQNQDPEVE